MFLLFIGNPLPTNSEPVDEIRRLEEEIADSSGRQDVSGNRSALGPHQIAYLRVSVVLAGRNARALLCSVLPVSIATAVPAASKAISF